MAKQTKWLLRLAKTRISQGIRQSSLSAWRNIGSSATHWDSGGTGQMPRLIWGFAGHTDYFVGFVMQQLDVIACKIQR